MANLVKPHPLAVDPWYFHVYSDFTNEDQLDSIGVDTITDSGSVTVGDAVGGILALVPSDGSVADNDEAYFAIPNEIFKFAAGKPLFAAASIQFAEANTSAANVAFGVIDAAASAAANVIVDNGAGMRASGSYAVLYKVDGETVWRCGSRNGSTVLTTTSTVTAGGSAYQHLEIEVVDRDALNATVVFKVDRQYLRDTSGVIIKHTLPLASATEMNLFVGVKNGSTSLETLNVDWWSCSQTR